MLRSFILVIFLALSFSEASAEAIGFLSPLTGPLSYMGEDALRGARLAAELSIPESDLIAEDTQYQTKAAVSAFQRLSAEGVGTFMVIGSPMVLAIKSISERGKIPVLALLSASPSILKGTQFMIRHSGRMDDQARALVPVLRSRFKAPRIAVISAEADWTLEFTNALRDEVKPLEKLVELSHLPGETDFSSMVLRVRQVAASVVIINSFGASVTKLVQELRGAGVSAPIYASSGLVISDRAIETLRKARIENLEYFTVADPPAAFSSLYAAKYGFKPRIFAYWGFQDVELLNHLMHSNDQQTNLARAAKDLRMFRGRFSTLTIAPDGDIIEPVILRRLEEGM